MTVVVPLSAFFMIISEFDLNSLSALRSLKGKLFRGLISSISASWTLTSSKNVSSANDRLTAGIALA